MKNILIGLVIGAAVMLPISVYAHQQNQGRKTFYLDSGEIEVRRFKDEDVTCYVSQTQVALASGSNTAISCVNTGDGSNEES